MCKIHMEANKKKIISILNGVNREGMQDLIKWFKSTDFFTAPASTKFHLNVEGVDVSWNVKFE